MDENYISFFENQEERIKNSIAGYIRKSISCSTSEILGNQAYNDCKEALCSKIIKAGNTEAFRKLILNAVNSKIDELEKNGATFKDILPQGFENNIKVCLYNNSPALITEVKKFVKSKDSEKRIKMEINKLAGSLNPMLSKLINADSLYIKLVQGVDNYFNDPGNTVKLVEAASKFIDNGMEKEISGIIMYFPYEGRKSMAEALADSIINIVFQPKNIAGMAAYFEDIILGYENAYQFMQSFIPELEELIESEAKELFDYIKLS